MSAVFIDSYSIYCYNNNIIPDIGGKNMKGFISFITALAIIGGAACASMPATAEAVQIRGYMHTERELTAEDIAEMTPVRHEDSGTLIYAIYDGFAMVSDVNRSIAESLEEIVIPETIGDLPVVGITDMPFIYCPKLKKITLSKDTQFFSRYDYLCDSLEEIVIPEENPYLRTEGNYLYSADLNTLIGVIPTAHTPVSSDIPTDIQKIDDYAFAGCMELEELTLPDSVREMGTGVFAGCENLREVTLPDKITVLPAMTFGSCKALSKVELPETVNEIGAYAFKDCHNLFDFHLPPHVTSIRMNAFENAGCTENMDGILYVDNWAVDADKDIQRADLREGTIGTCEALFDNNKALKVITIPESVEYMGRLLVFTMYNHIERVDFYNKIIGQNALTGCTHLKMVWIHDKDCRIADSPKTIPQYWTEDKGETEDITIIGVNDEPAEEPEKFNTLIFGAADSTALKYASFYNREFHLADEKEYTYDKEYTQQTENGVIYNVSKYSSTAEEREDNSQPDVFINSLIGDSQVTNISSGLFFRGDTPVEKLHISDNLAAPSYYEPFYNYCSYYETGEDCYNYTAVDDILYSKDMHTLISCPKNYDKTEIVIPDGVVYIGSYAFMGCDKVEKITLPDSVTEIDTGAFRAAANLKSVVLPEKLEQIGFDAFRDCASLTNVTIPASVHTVYSNAFSGTAAYEVEDGVQYIGDWAVGVEKSAAEMTIRQGTKKVAVIDFSGSKVKSAYIPAETQLCDHLTYSADCNIETLIIESPAIEKDQISNLYHLKDIYINDISCNISSNAIPTISAKPPQRTIVHYLGGEGAASSVFTGYEYNSAAGPAIHGRTNSTAHEYANVHNMKFIPTDEGEENFVRCDINGDNRLNIADYVLFSKYLRGRIELTEQQALTADINQDGVTDIFDMVELRIAFLRQ